MSIDNPVLLSTACFSPFDDVCGGLFRMFYLETLSHLRTILTRKDQERRKYE